MFGIPKSLLPPGSKEEDFYTRTLPGYIVEPAIRSFFRSKGYELHSKSWSNDMSGEVYSWKSVDRTKKRSQPTEGDLRILLSIYYYKEEKLNLPGQLGANEHDAAKHVFHMPMEEVEAELAIRSLGDVGG